MDFNPHSAFFKKSQKTDLKKVEIIIAVFTYKDCFFLLENIFYFFIESDIVRLM